MDNLKYYAINQNGAHNFIVREIANPENVLSAIEGKRLKQWEYLSVNRNGIIDINPAAPLYIYGAITASVIVDNYGQLIYSQWSGEHKTALDKTYINAFLNHQNAQQC